MTASYASKSSAASITDLVRFVLARMDEDDAHVKRLSRPRQVAGRHLEAQPAVAAPADLRSLERLRAECAARRQIHRSVQHLLVLRDQPCEKPVRDAAAQILRALASAYSDHPQYRDEWRPLIRH